MNQPFNRIAACLLPALMLAVAGCATSTIESRRKEKAAFYESLPAEVKASVDQGQIKVGMPSDAVYIALGKPAEVLESEDENGRLTIWRYYGTWMQQNKYWVYREVGSPKESPVYLERYPVVDYNPRDYVRSEVVIVGGRVKSWRNLGRPVN